MPDASLPQAMRRARLAAALNERGGGIALVPTAPERPRNADSDHPYRHGSDFHYLSGFDEPQAWLLVAANGHSTLLCRERHEERELWDGRRLGVVSDPGAQRQLAELQAAAAQTSVVHGGRAPQEEPAG